MKNRLLLSAAALMVMLAPAAARKNSTGAFGTFMITDCKTCTDDGDSIWCTEGKGGDEANFVKVGSNRTFSIADKKKMFPGADGGKYCWAGLFTR